jgi:DNA-binding NarL/FixJ family response regulator
MKKRSEIRIAVADDSIAFRRAFLEILRRSNRGIRVVGEAGNGEELLSLARSTPVDVFVMDIEMPVLSGIETLERLLKERPGSKVVVLSMYRDRVLVEKAFRAGAHGYVLKESAVEDIVQAIVEVNGGGSWSSPQIK